MIKMLFYTGARVSEFVQFRVEDRLICLYTEPSKIEKVLISGRQK